MRDFGQTPSRLLSKRGQLGNQMAWIWSVDQVSGDDPSLKLRREVTCGSRSIAEYFGTKAPHDGSKAGLCPDRTVERIRSTSRPPLWNPEPKSNGSGTDVSHVFVRFFAVVSGVFCLKKCCVFFELLLCVLGSFCS